MIYLEPPSYRPGGPDGKGWNRLSLNAHMGAAQPRCALRPRTYPALWTSHRNTAHAEWGGDYGLCHHDGACGTCPVLTGPPRHLDATGDTVLVRVRERGEPSDLIPGGVASDLWVQTHPDRGESWSWDQLCRLDGWKIGRAHHDDEGAGFWLHRVPDPANPTHQRLKGRRP